MYTQDKEPLSHRASTGTGVRFQASGLQTEPDYGLSLWKVIQVNEMHFLEGDLGT